MSLNNNTIEIDLENLTGPHLNDYWKEGKTIRGKFSIAPPDQNTSESQQDAAPEKDIAEIFQKYINPVRAQVQSYLQNQDKTNKNTRTIEEITSKWPVLPCPLLPSRLFMALAGNEDEPDKTYSSHILVNSFQVLRALVVAESEIVRIMKEEYEAERKKELEEENQKLLQQLQVSQPKGKKNKNKKQQKKEGSNDSAPRVDPDKVVKKKLDIMSIVLQRVYWQLVDIFGHFKGTKEDNTLAEVTEVFMAENFQNCMNLIRVYEFTILDLISFPKKEQAKWVTFDVYPTPNNPEVINWPQMLAKDTWDAVLQRLQQYPNKVFETKVQETIDSKSWGDFQGWSSNLSISITMWWAKTFIKDNKWKCGNCQNKESHPGEFKQCGSCGWVRYCSRECQVNHWKADHKQGCNKVLTRADIQKQRILVGAEVNDESEHVHGEHCNHDH